MRDHAEFKTNTSLKFSHKESSFNFQVIAKDADTFSGYIPLGTSEK